MIYSYCLYLDVNGFCREKQTLEGRRSVIYKTTECLFSEIYFIDIFASTRTTRKFLYKYINVEENYCIDKLLCNEIVQSKTNWYSISYMYTVTLTNNPPHIPTSI